MYNGDEDRVIWIENKNIRGLVWACREINIRQGSSDGCTCLHCRQQHRTDREDFVSIVLSVHGIYLSARNHVACFSYNIWTDDAFLARHSCCCSALSVQLDSPLCDDSHSLRRRKHPQRFGACDGVSQKARQYRHEDRRVGARHDPCWLGV